jgi:hypothetical protein
VCITNRTQLTKKLPPSVSSAARPTARTNTALARILLIIRLELNGIVTVTP